MENREAIGNCQNYHQLKMVFPGICMNCAMRDGYPVKETLPGPWCKNYAEVKP